MTSRLLALSLLAVACAQPTPEGSLIENHGPTSAEVKGLLRTAEGPFIRGQVETLTAVYDAAHVRAVSWSATAGALSSREGRVTWTLPQAEHAELTLTLRLDDGRELVTPFGFSLVEAPQPENAHVARSAREALLATPMPVIDGGTAEITGGACDMEYDSTANVNLAFTSGTHPAVYFGKWNGSAWTLEVMDTLGFNTGGRISPAQVHVRVDASGNPHVLYFRDAQLWYATKVGANWTRERVDNATQYLDSSGATASIGLNATGRPSVIYETYLSGYQRVVFATRTAPNTWAATTLTFPLGTIYSSRVHGDLLFDAAGTAYFPAEIYSSTNSGYYDYLASWTGTVAEVKAVNTTLAPGWDLASYKGSSGVWAGPGRALFRTSAGLYDFSLAAPLTNSTFTWSANESGGAGVGDLAWNGRPVMLHHHSGGNLELVTPAATGAAFWTWTQLGVSSGVSGAVVVHPSTGVPSICYQSGGRIMFQ